MHDVRRRDSSYGPGKQRYIELCSRQIDRDDVRLAEIDATAQCVGGCCPRPSYAAFVGLETDYRSDALRITPGKSPVARAYLEHVAPPQTAEAVEDPDLVSLGIKCVELRQECSCAPPSRKDRARMPPVITSRRSAPAATESESSPERVAEEHYR